MTMTNQELYDAVQEHGGFRPASRIIGVPESTIRRRLRDFVPGLPPGAFSPTQEEIQPTHITEQGVSTTERWSPDQKGTRRYILTSAQNNARVHDEFWENLQALARDMDAEIMVSCVLYDKTGYRGLVRKGERKTNKVWWDERIKPYMTNERVRLHRRLAFCGEMDILATAKRPLSGLQSYCGRSSIIVPHNRFAFQCVESRKGQMPKEMFTTGSCTHRRFVQRKTGQVASFHHVLGALLVEVTEDGYWHVHHLNAEEDGSFFWLDREYRDGDLFTTHNCPAALIVGDIHYEKKDADVLRATFTGIESICGALRPETVVLHDLMDFNVRNHHTLRDPFEMYKVKKRSVEEDILKAGQFVAFVGHNFPGVSFGPDVFVVPANHDEMLVRWLKEEDWRRDPLNMKFYLQAALHMIRRADRNQRTDSGLLQWAIQSYHGRANRGSIKFLEVDESLEIAGVECGMHGHIGPSGAFGTPSQFARLGFKTFTGHTHTPSIVDGCYTVGVAGKLDMEYNRGPSKWMHCHGIIYPNGKRAFLFIKNRRWRAPK